MPSFPVKGSGAGFLSQGESPTMYMPDIIDTALKSPTEGGYEFRRRFTTRAPRRTMSTGFLSLPHADYLILDAFWVAHTTVDSFSYTDYMMGVTRTVRFDEFKPTYVGIGQNRMWTIKIKMSEV